MPVIGRLRAWARRIRRDTLTLWFAVRHPDAPILPRVLCLVAVAYALSPIDLIPDFIPVLGYLDELILLPALIWLAIRALPPDVVVASRREADRWLAEGRAKPTILAGAAVILLIWLALLWTAWSWLAGPAAEVAPSHTTR